MLRLADVIRSLVSPLAPVRIHASPCCGCRFQFGSARQASLTLELLEFVADLFDYRASEPSCCKRR